VIGRSYGTRLCSLTWPGNQSVWFLRVPRWNGPGMALLDNILSIEGASMLSSDNVRTSLQ